MSEFTTEDKKQLEDRILKAIDNGMGNGKIGSFFINDYGSTYFLGEGKQLSFWPLEYLEPILSKYKLMKRSRKQHDQIRV